MGDSRSGAAAYCDQQFANVTQTQVVIKNPSDTVVGYGTLQAPTLDETAGTCVALWTATGLPGTGEVLSYEIGSMSMKPIYFTQSDANRLILTVPDGGYGHPIG
jgi:hypothetical protein